MTSNLIENNLQSLYDTDYLEWLSKNIELLKSRRFNELDMYHLLQEFESLGNSEKRAVESLLENIIIHLLLIEYWEQEREYNLRHWAGEIVNFRNQLQRRLSTNLRNHLRQNLEMIYHGSVKVVAVKTGITPTIFSAQCPYTIEQLIDSDWIPFL